MMYVCSVVIVQKTEITALLLQDTKDVKFVYNYDT